MTGAARQYLLDVEGELADLPVEERTELLEDLSLHLTALEEERDEQPWETRLGSAAEYARELRAAAGLPERTVTRRGRMAELRAVGERVVRARAVRETWAFVPQLRPAWWVLRGYLVVLLPSLRGVNDFPVPAPGGNRVLGVVLTVVAVVASVAVGRWRLPRPAVAVVLAGNLALLGYAAGFYEVARTRLTQVRIVHGSVIDVAPWSAPLVSHYGQVTNVLPYSADGTPLSGVLLFDQDGRPLHVGTQQWWPDHCRRVPAAPLAADGVPVTYSFPQRYVLTPEPGSVCVGTLPTPKVPIPVFPTTAPVSRSQTPAGSAR
jgi:hypothetical protein